MTEQREKNAYNEYLVMPRLKKLFTLLGEAGVDGYLTMGADWRIGINASLTSGEAFISFFADNVSFSDLLKVRNDACDMLLSISYASDTEEDLKGLIVPEELIGEADDVEDLIAAYESGLWLNQDEAEYDGERIKEMLRVLEERGLVITDKTADKKKPHILIESTDRFIELSVVNDSVGRPLVLMRAPLEADSDIAVCTVFPDNGAIKSGELYEREIGIFERYYAHLW